MILRRFVCAAAISASFLASLAVSQELVVRPGHSDGVYAAGERIRWTVEYKGGELSEVSLLLKRGGLTEMRKGIVRLSEGKGEIEAQLDEPGWLLAEVTARPQGGKAIKALGGAVVDPGSILRAEAKPADFDAFWAEKIKQLAAIPSNPKLERADAKKSDVEFFEVTLDNIRGSKVRGQLARPQQGAKFPAMLIVQWAGVYALQKQWVTDRAAEGRSEERRV